MKYNKKKLVKAIAKLDCMAAHICRWFVPTTAFLVLCVAHCYFALAGMRSIAICMSVRWSVCLSVPSHTSTCIVMGGFPNPLPTGYPPFIFSWFFCVRVYLMAHTLLPLNASGQGLLAAHLSTVL